MFTLLSFVSSKTQMIDVSFWDDIVDYNKVKESNISTVIVRVAYGTKKPDSMFESNILNASAAGFKIGVYTYGLASTVSEAEEEADYVLKLIEPYKDKISLCVAYDVEDSVMNVGKQKVASMVIQFANKVREKGYTPWLYSNYNWANNFINMTSIDSNDIQFWIAQYSSECTYAGKYVAWQYTGSGKVPGMPNDDCDISWLM